MDVRIDQQPARETPRLQANRAELAERIADLILQDGTSAPLKGVQLRRSSTPTDAGYSVSFPALCVVAQGSKEILLAGERYRYDPSHYLITTATLPIASHITEASPERPYLRLLLELDPTLVSSVMVEAGHSAPRSRSDVKAIDVSPLDGDLLESVVRLVRLVESPTDARFLAPLIRREIIYRLLMGEQGGRFRHIAVLGGTTHRITEAIERMRNDFDQPIRIEDMARELGMSVSGFHHHFRAVTAMSSLQFHKQLRLQEPRRLMLSTDLDAASAGLRVGYGDQSHFTREYRRLFGAPPTRDVAQLREAVMEPAAL
jgi:AraC-like DNA-binding protein